MKELNLQYVSIDSAIERLNTADRPLTDSDIRHKLLIAEDF